MDFVLALHSHLPYVLNHGRWPHGSDWLTEAVVDTYLPLLEALRALEHEGTPTPVTIGITPVLANQLASPDLVPELEQFFDQRIAAAREAGATLSKSGDDALVPLARYWDRRLSRLRAVYERLGGDLVGAFRGLAERGRIELISSAATHGFLPLLATDASIRLQLDVGRREHRRLFGQDPAGIWLPECAYRPRGPWRPFPGSGAGVWRRGIEQHVADFGYRYFFADAHMAKATDSHRSPYRVYQVNPVGEGPAVGAFVRDPRSSAQVWSRHGGYPGGEWYLEFHKTRWPGGLKFWRVSAPGSDLGAKRPYEPQRAHASAVDHGRHFSDLLTSVANRERWDVGDAGVIVAPFDTELFGHWWFEGPEFLATVWRSLRRGGPVRAVTAGEHLSGRVLRHHAALGPGSWGKDGDWSMWNGSAVAWSWPALWRMEAAFWDVAPAALADEQARPALAQAARSLLLAQSSDWQFIISTGEADDYAIKRLKGHLEDTDGLVGGLRHGLSTGEWDGVRRFASQLAARDSVFPDVLDSVAVSLGGATS